MKRKVTLTDVAELANVSLGTASQALNNKGRIPEATRNRVIEAAKQVGYDSRYVFSQEPSQALRTIAILKHDSYDRPILDPFYYPVMSGVVQECQRLGISVVYATVEVDQQFHLKNLPASFLRNKLDGVICVGTYLSPNSYQELLNFHCPIVLVEGYSWNGSFDSVTIDNVEGAYRAASHLIENGHRHIGLIGSSPDAYPSLVERREGYFRALKDHGLPDAYVQDSLIFRDSATEAAGALLDRFPHLTAIFVCNDNAAIGVMKTIHNRDRKVPDDISVVGFDDISFSQDLTPPLTTMRVDKMLLGRLGVLLMQFRVENTEAPVLTFTVKTELIARKSVRRIA